jgi:hypothetical protein
VALFGVNAWAAVMAGSAQGPLGDGWALATATRLALIRWLGDFSPDPLDGDLLDMEGAVLTDRLSSFLPAPEVTDSARQRALTLSEAVLRGAPTGPPEVSSLAQDLLALLGDQGDGEAGQVAEALKAHKLESERIRQALEWALGSILTPVPHGLVLDDPAVESAPVWRTCSTDWDLVPRGVFSADEDAIRWRIDPEPGGAARVTVEARAGWATRGSYLARLLCTSTRMPAAVIPLHRNGDLWSGSAPLIVPVIDPDECWIDLTSEATPRPARRGTPRIAARGRRWAARGATRLRFGLTEGALLNSSTPMSEAIGSLERSRMAYSDLAARPQRGDDGLRHFELGLTLHSALGRRGEHYETDDLAQELQVEAGALRESHLGPEPVPLPVVDLNHPGWQLSVAELGMLVPTIGR